MKFSADDEARMTAKLNRWQSSRRNVLVTVVSTTAIILVALAYLAKTYKPLPKQFSFQCWDIHFGKTPPTEAR
jgi:hypothetical protein